MAKYFERPSEETQLFISPSIYAIDHSDIFPTIDTVAYGAIGSSDHHQRDQSSDLSARDYHRPTSRRFQLSYAQICCMLLNFLCEMFDIITIVPIIMMLEESVCRSYYLEHDPGAIADDGSIATHLCKIAPIQSSLASIRGWKALLEILPGQHSHTTTLVLQTYANEIVQFFSLPCRSGRLPMDSDAKKYWQSA